MKNTMKTILALMLVALGLNTAVAAEPSPLLKEATQLLGDYNAIQRIPKGPIKDAAIGAFNPRIEAAMSQWEALYTEDFVAARRLFGVYFLITNVSANDPRYLAPKTHIDLSALTKQHWKNEYVAKFATDPAEIKAIPLKKYDVKWWWLNSEEASTMADEGAFHAAAERLKDGTILDYALRQYLGRGRTDDFYVHWFNDYIRPLPITEAIAMLKTEIRGVTSKPEEPRRNKVLQNYITSLAVLEKL